MNLKWFERVCLGVSGFGGLAFTLSLSLALSRSYATVDTPYTQIRVVLFERECTFGKLRDFHLTLCALAEIRGSLENEMTSFVSLEHRCCTEMNACGELPVSDNGWQVVFGVSCIECVD